MPTPSLKNVVGEGETRDVDVYAHVQAPQGMNVWAGTERDGTPIPVDEAAWTRGQEFAKLSKQPHTYDEAVKK